MLEITVKQTETFGKLVKKLSKKYKNIEHDIDTFVDNIEEITDLGVSLGKNIYKARIKNSDNNKGKSGGYRLITYLQLTANELVLVYIYSKSEIENIEETELDKIIMQSIVN